MKNISGINPSDEQARAISAIVDWYKNSQRQEFLLDGQAGTGKSTTAAFAIAELRALKKRRAKTILCAALSGKAAHVMRQKGIEDATTIHSLIYTLTGEEEGQLRWKLNPVSPCRDADLIVIDEVSMVNDQVANDLRSFGKKILVLGDVDGQLPPVDGSGAFTRREPDFRLLQLNRFALESPIIRIAAQVRRSEPIAAGHYGADVIVLPLDGESWRRIYRPDTQVICGTHRTRWTVSQLIRKEIGLDGPRPLQGDRIICRRNCAEFGLFNGALGVVTAPPEEDREGNLILSVRMDDHDRDLASLSVHPYLFDQHFSGPSQRPLLRHGALEFDWSYCLTCHSAQGSEWPHVTVIDDSGAFRSDPHIARRWLYTAVTRASRGLTLLLRDRR